MAWLAEQSIAMPCQLRDAANIVAQTSFTAACSAKKFSESLQVERQGRFQIILETRHRRWKPIL